MRREVSQLHRCDRNGRDEVGTLKVWVAAPHKQVTVSSREEGIITDKSVTKIMWKTLSTWYIAACCLYVVIALKYKPDPARPALRTKCVSQFIRSCRLHSWSGSNTENHSFCERKDCPLSFFPILLWKKSILHLTLLVGGSPKWWPKLYHSLSS